MIEYSARNMITHFYLKAEEKHRRAKGMEKRWTMKQEKFEMVCSMLCSHLIYKFPMNILFV